MSDFQSVRSDEKTLAMLSHLLALFFGFLAPLIIWLTQKDESAFVDRHGKEALNFQISFILYAVISIILMFIIIGIFLFIALVICDIIFIISGCIKASRGEEYRYPLSIRFIQ